MITRPSGRSTTAILFAALVTLVAADAASAGPRVAVISDLNGSYGSVEYHEPVRAAVRRLIELRPDLVICTGDMVAGQRLHPPLGRAAVVAMWQSFHENVSEPLRRAGIPLAVTPGNHDASVYESFAMEREEYRAQWSGRVEGLSFVDRGDYPFHYAVAAGDTLFVSLDVTRVGALDDEQMHWLDGLLVREGGRFRHRIAFAHLPVYPFTQGRETEVTADRRLERMLKARGVEIFLSGHHHAFYPGYHDGIRHVSQACLGSGSRRLIGTSEAAPRAITLLELGEDGVRIEALTGPRFDRPLDVSTLPREIRSRFVTLVRDDLRNEAAVKPMTTTAVRR